MIIFLDVDGTLVDYESNIPESAVDAIRKARDNGHKVYICTGRSKAEIYDDIWKIGLDGLIGGNGCYVESNGQVVMHQKIGYEECVKIVDWLHDNGLEFYLECNSGLYGSEHFEKKGEPVIREYSKRKGKENAAKMTIRDVFPDMIFGEQLYRDDVNKISYILNSYEDFEKTKERFFDYQNGTWGGAEETALFGDIGVKNIDKGNAIRTLVEYIGGKMEETVAIGDAKVDIPMFEICGTGICMGNGGEETKKAADYVTSDVNDDGLYNAFKHLKLI